MTARLNVAPLDGPRAADRRSFRAVLADEIAAWPGGKRDILRDRGLRVILIHRLSEVAAARNLPLLPMILTQLNLTVHGIDIARGAKLGRHVQIPHPVGVVIGAKAVIEGGALTQSCVTLGEHLMDDRPDGCPTIGPSAHLGSGSKLFGPVKIGERAEIGANTVVTRDVDPWTVVAGNPMRVIRDRPGKPA